MREKVGSVRFAETQVFLGLSLQYLTVLQSDQSPSFWTGIYSAKFLMLLTSSRKTACIKQ